MSRDQTSYMLQNSIFKRIVERTISVSEGKNPKSHSNDISWFCSNSEFWWPDPALLFNAHYVHLVVWMWPWLSWELRGIFTHISSKSFQELNLLWLESGRGEGRFPLGIIFFIFGAEYSMEATSKKTLFSSWCHGRDGMATGVSLEVAVTCNTLKVWRLFLKLGML